MDLFREEFLVVLTDSTTLAPNYTGRFMSVSLSFESSTSVAALEGKYLSKLSSTQNQHLKK